MQHMGRGGDVFSPSLLRAGDGIGQGLAGADLGQFHQHGQVHARDHLHAFALHHGNGEVGGSAAEHVGEQHDPVSGVAPSDACLDLGAAGFNVVFRSDTDRVDTFLGSHDMFHGEAKLLRQASMRDQDHADHGRSDIFRVDRAPSGPWMEDLGMEDLGMEDLEMEESGFFFLFMICSQASCA